MCASPFIDGLVWVTDEEQIAMHLTQNLIDFPVLLITVLSFINHHVVHLSLPFCPDIIELMQNIQGEIDEVLEIKRKVLSLSEESADENLLCLLFTLIIYISLRVKIQLTLRVGQQESRYIVDSAASLDFMEFLQEAFDSRLFPFNAMLFESFLGDSLHVLFIKNLKGLRIAKSEDLFS